MVELIPKEAPPIPRWLNILFYVALILLFLTIISFFKLNNYLEKSQKELQELEELLLKGKSSEKISLEREVLNYEKKIRNFNQFSEQHLETSKIFPIIEENTHPEIWFSGFNLSSRDEIVSLSGKTEDFENLGQQILIFDKEDSIKGMNLEKILISKEGDIEFDLSLYLDPEILR